MERAKLKIGMPAGSLANAQRGGGLVDLLAASGFRTQGYDKGGPTRFTGINLLFGWDGRPQEFGSQLEIGELDVAIAGDDWIRERVIEMKLEYGVDVELERVMTLNRGEVQLVGIVADAAFGSTEDFLRSAVARRPLLTVASEMPYLALDWMQRKLAAIGRAEDFAAYAVQKYKTPPKIERGILVYESWGKTESKVKHGAVDIGLEISQTGGAIKSYGLTVVETVMRSQTSIYVNPAVSRDQEKQQLLEMFLLNLYGATHAENKVMLLFNVPNRQLDEIERYLASHNLFGDEPTVNKGKEYAEYNIQVDADDAGKPLAMVRYQLARLGARSINTIPITSSIPGIRVIRKG
jgi:ATP phosphoribosyltransferase-like protein